MCLQTPKKFSPPKPQPAIILGICQNVLFGFVMPVRVFPLCVFERAQQFFQKIGKGVLERVDARTYSAGVQVSSFLAIR